MELKTYRCKNCGKIIIYNTPKEMGWKIIDEVYVCTWCQDIKIEYKKIKITKPLIIETNIKGGIK
jgi:predicted SprT family Zn-dependent metalloprotease